MADWSLILGYLVLVSWMMFASFNTKGNKLEIANPEYSDFGPNTALMQSFAVGHNFPTEYPHFSGDRIRYHFLFYFQAGNLEFLGLNPAWSLNLLSITTIVAMLVIVMTLGEVLFESRAVGRLGSLLFFFFGSLSYVPFLQKQGSIRAAIQAITNQREYLPTIFPYRGDAWGTWSQVTYLNQRHFAFAIGILLLVLVFLVVRYREVAAKRAAARVAARAMIPQPDRPPETAPASRIAAAALSSAHPFPQAPSSIPAALAHRVTRREDSSKVKRSGRLASRARAMSGRRTLGSCTGRAWRTTGTLLPVIWSTVSASSATVNSAGFPRLVGSVRSLRKRR